jgi:hypothetical protein
MLYKQLLNYFSDTGLGNFQEASLRGISFIGKPMCVFYRVCLSDVAGTKKPGRPGL